MFTDYKIGIFSRFHRPKYYNPLKYFNNNSGIGFAILRCDVLFDRILRFQEIAFRSLAWIVENLLKQLG